MSDLLQFLVPLVIAGIIFLVNQAGKKGDQEKQDPRRTQPPVKNWQEKQHRKSKERPAAQHTQTKAPESVQAEQTAEELIHTADNAIERVTSVQKAVPARQHAKKSSVAKPIRITRPTSRQLAEQVIWSEILGESRAKKPHRAFGKRVH
ncbi:hypothetical protein SAMN05421503_1924 [Terribacillus aidingensis]|uniref:Uncharacterized protein n=1 Tax=Terribacillus aidingensis TaxID=586416 RepID=A0A285NNA4_9BACI|nr:hypothetical protein [Terribacillus aidingensis]SNZ11000.1 hypothetical protein SAMN05421503_1924 [Terribacillus aidingensis]